MLQVDETESCELLTLLLVTGSLLTTTSLINALGFLTEMANVAVLVAFGTLS